MGIHQDTESAPTSTSAAVHLVGRLGNRIESRQLPSGDEVVTFTVIVDRPRRARGAPGPRVDAIACQAFRAPLRRRIAGWEPGTWIEVEGALRRRFWRAGGGLGSAMEVEVTRLSRVRRDVRA